ncbi:MAG: PAS domain S-box protein [Eubacteriales bacterium]|nr:PAS domain S-box protein [Eubacteriales bacterium]
MEDKYGVPVHSFNDAFFQTVFQASPDATLITRVSDGAIMHVNDGFCRITGYTQEEVVGKTALELNLYYNPADHELFLSSMTKTGVLETRPAYFRRRDGSRYSALVSAHSFWSQGDAYVCASIRDVSEQQRIERKNSKREEEYRRLFETMAQGIVYQNAEGWVISANPAAERMLGLTFQEMSQRTSQTPEWHAIREDGSPLPGDEHPAMIALRTGTPFGPYTFGVFNAQLNDHVWLTVTATPLFHDGEEKPYQVYAIMENITAQRKAQKNYQLLFQEMVDGFALHEIICDEAGAPVDYRYLAVNPAFERMTGLCGSDLIGRTVLSIMPEIELFWIETYGQVALTGEPVTFQNYSAALDKYFSVTAYRPAPMQFACTFSDVTKQIRYQQETEQAQAQINRLAHICDVAPSSIIIHDDAGKILYANEYACSMLGYQNSAFLTMKLSDLCATATSEAIAKSARRARQEGEITNEIIARAIDGRAIPLLICGRPIEWDGKPAMLTIGTDMTERQQAEKTLEQSLAQNHRILNTLQDGFFQASLDGTYFLINPRMTQIFGYISSEEMMAINTKQTYANMEDRVVLLDKLQADGHVTSYVCRGKRKDGSFIWISMHVQYLRNEAGDVIGTEGLIRDITDRRKMEEEIQKQHNSLITTNEILRKRLEQSINAISKIGELRDAYTAGHQRRVQQLSCQIGARCGLSGERMINLSYGALIHDIGKIHVASDILNKPGKITSLEYQLLQTHAEYSYNIVREMGLPQDIATMVHQHHERLDGSGYPNHVSGDQILLESRILAVADVVEAMTSHRPYRPALGIEAALAEIQAGRGTKFDEIVVDHCVSLFREEGFQFNKETDEAV